MTHCLRLLTIACIAILLPACATHPQRPARDVHHYSRDDAGNRLACYTTGVAKEYECYPVDEHLARHHHHYYDPLWPLIGLGLVYSWHHHPYYVGHHYWHPHGYRHRRWRR